MSLGSHRCPFSVATFPQVLQEYISAISITPFHMRSSTLTPVLCIVTSPFFRFQERPEEFFVRRWRHVGDRGKPGSIFPDRHLGFLNLPGYSASSLRETTRFRGDLLRTHFDFFAYKCPLNSGTAYPVISKDRAWRTSPSSLRISACARPTMLDLRVM
jgi:hypothetical protein